MTIPHEIELKLELEPVGKARRRPTALLAALPGPGETRHLLSRYFDTAGHDLRRNGFVLRVRQEGDRRIQTLKGEAAGSLLARPEWEVEVAGDVPDLAAFDDAAELPLDPASFAAFVPLFETRVERTVWRVARGGSQMEVALDEGVVAGPGAAAPIREVELELKDGSPGDLFDLARDLAAQMPMRIGILSKSERGYALVGPKPAGPVKAEKVALRPKASAGEAFRVVALACIRHFRLNEADLLAARDAEALHQARVAIRRLRSAFTLFRAVVDGPEARRLEAGLRRLSLGLGEARNLDVYLGRRIAAEAERHPGEPGLPELRARLETDREAAYDRVVRHLRSRRFRASMLDLAAFVEAGEWTRDPARAESRDEPARHFATRIVKRRWRKVRRKGRHVEALEPAARHRVRIEAKKLRYASEFFAGLFGRKGEKRRHRAFVAALERLQEALGDLNDIATGHEMALALAEGGAEPPALLFAAGHVSGEGDAREAGLLRAAAEAHRALRKAEPFWT